jgi:hypothetical protein
MLQFLESRRQTLEDAFFAKQDALLIAKQRELERMAHTRQVLAEVSGIRNERILQRLVELEVEPDVLASLALVPLVEVAWADGEVHERERKAILDGAAGAGIKCGTVDFILLEGWLKRKPEPKLLDAWTHYVAGLCEVLNEQERDALQADLLSRARAVAEAAGGFLGLGSKVCIEEKTVLDKMAAAFRRPAGPAAGPRP